MCPGGASFTPGAGSPLGRRGEGTGLRSNLFPCAQGPRIPAPRLGAGPALPSSPPTSGHLQGSTVGDADRAPIALHTPHPHPRRLPVVPGVGLLGQQSRSPRELGRWVGGVGVGNPIRDLSVPGQVAAPGAARSPRRASLPSPLPALHLPHPRRAPAQLRRELSSPKLQEMFSQVVAVEASFMCVCVCVCVCVYSRARAWEGKCAWRGGTREASHLAKTRFLSLWAL